MNGLIYYKLGEKKKNCGENCVTCVICVAPVCQNKCCTEP